MPELERRFILSGYGDTVTAGVAKVVTFAKSERIARAWKGLATLWGAALASAFIPVAHFLLVPGLAIAGLIVFGGRIRTSERTRSIVGSCPHCGLQQDFGSTGPWELPLSVACHGCGRSLTARNSETV